MASSQGNRCTYRAPRPDTRAKANECEGYFHALDNLFSYAAWPGKQLFPHIKARIGMVWKIFADKSAKSPPTNPLNLGSDTARKPNERSYLRTFPLTYKCLPFIPAHFVVQTLQTPDL